MLSCRGSTPRLKSLKRQSQKTIRRTLSAWFHGFSPFEPTQLFWQGCAMSLQLPESYAVLRTAIEQAWYALHIAKDTHPPDRANVWLSRSTDKYSKSKCRNEFAIGNVRSTHELFDCPTAKQLYELYERTIDFRGHPNEKSVSGAMARLATENEINFSIGILSFRDPVLVVAALHMAVGVATGTLKVFQLIFPERFLILGLDAKVEALIRDLNSVFKQYAPKN